MTATGDGGGWDLAALTTEQVAALVADPRPLAVLVPVGSVEPHGPHLPLGTDTEISRAACERAAASLEAAGVLARIAPPVAYGVTECARAFSGAVSIPPDVLAAYLGAVIEGLLAAGADHVCLVNNHLEPAHDAAVRRAVQAVRDADSRRASAACPLSRRWARELPDEFKRGECHAGRYETSIVMACAPHLVDDAVRRGLPEVPVSLSDKLRAGVTDFADMGLSRAYAGAPAAATAAEGDATLAVLAEMIASEVRGALAS